MIQSSTMTNAELVRVNGFLPHGKHESAAVALDFTETLSARLGDLMESLHELSDAKKIDLIVGLNDAFYAIKAIKQDLDSL